jgi:hypothetical protein
MTHVASPVGAVERPEPASAEDPAADPDLDLWQEDRWAPHSFEPETGDTRSFARGEGSFHDRTWPRPRPWRPRAIDGHAGEEAPRRQRAGAERQAAGVPGVADGRPARG